jgi:signal transduction histidine kinase
MDGQPAAAQFRIRSRGRADLLLAVAAGIEMQVELLFPDAARGDLLIARGMVLVLAAALALRRRAPLVAATLAIGVLAGMELLDEAVSDDLIVPFFAVLFVSYSVGANTDGRRLACGVAILLGLGAVAVLLDGGSADDMLFLTSIVVGGPVLLGLVVHDRARLSRALREKTAALEATRAARRAAAVSQERARIAGELHELVTGAIAAMVAEADTAERHARSDPATAASALATIETSGREALGEIRRLLGVLRRDDEDAALEPVPSLTHLAELVARTCAAGLPVELRVDGDPPALPAGLDVTAYRVVQEALGEALAAGDARRATVLLRYCERELLLEVSDAGETARSDARRLLGIHERVTLYGGELVAEPLKAGGHAVRARLPLERA